MSEWKDHKIIDIVEKICVGFVGPCQKYYCEPHEGVPMIRTTNLTQRNISFDDVKYVTYEFHDKNKKSQLKYGDILVARHGDNGKACMYLSNDEANCLNAVIIRPDSKKVNPKFFLYQFNSPIVRGTIESMSSGSVQDVINTKQIQNLEILLPERETQDIIASVLSSLDGKIDLLHRQNATLEKMAETLFRQWFVEEAKEEWEVKPLGILVSVKRGGSPRPIQDYLSDTGLRWLKISDATKENSPYVFEIKEHIKVEGLNKTTHLKAGTLVLSNSATPGIPKILQVDSCIHDGWLHFPKSHFSNEFLYLLFKKIRPELLQQGNGSIFTNLKTDILKEYPIPIADNESLLFFDNQVKPIFNKILKNQTQIRTLTAMRDTLLPKLMSGEVRVEM